MKKRLLSALLALCMALSLLPAASAADPVSKELSARGSGEFSISINGTQAYAYAYQVAEQVNRLRAGLGLSQLVIDPVLMETAMQRAAECAVYYSHTRPNGTGCNTAFPSRNWTTLAENIAAGYTTPDGVMNGWTNSPGHYANMTNTGVNAIGVGCFYANGIYYWAQSFTGGAYSSGSAGLTDRTATVTLPAVKEYFFPAGGTGAISLRVGESCQLPVYTRNSGFYNYTATLSGVSGTALSAGADLVRLNSDTLTITAVAPGSGTVTLSLPSGDALSFTVQVTGQANGPVTERFTDVPDGIWYAEAVNWAAKEGYVDGYTDGTFRPTTDMTEEQILTLLHHAAGSPASDAPLPGGIADGKYYSTALRWAMEKGMIDSTFRLDTPCTRATSIYYLWQGYGSQSAEGGASFSDVPEDAYYAEAVAWAVEEGIVDGYTDGTYRPNVIFTRAQIAALLYKTLVHEARAR